MDQISSKYCCRTGGHFLFSIDSRFIINNFVLKIGRQISIVKIVIGNQTNYTSDLVHEIEGKILYTNLISDLQFKITNDKSEP